MKVPTGADIRRWGLSGLALLALATTARANLALAYAGVGAATGQRGSRSTR